MLLEIAQIKRWLAKQFAIKTEGAGNNLRLLAEPPNGTYKIRIGVTRKTAHVTISDGRISIK